MRYHYQRWMLKNFFAYLFLANFLGLFFLATLSAFACNPLLHNSRWCFLWFSFFLLGGFGFGWFSPDRRGKPLLMQVQE
jgi:hypothetical protein